MTDSVAEKVVGMLASVKHIPPERITLDSSLQDLGFDSLDVITMLFELEKEFEISIPDDEARSVTSVRGIVERIRKLLAAASTDSAAPAN
jgi:acyl carrier protein